MKDNAIILACDRSQACLLDIRVDILSAPASGYVAGTVMAYNTVTGFYMPYASGGASGLAAAKCVLFSDVKFENSTADLAVGIFEGKVFQAKLTGLDSTAISSLNARSVTDANGTQILIF